MNDVLSFFFIKGLIIGLVIAAPVGPIGILCIQRSLHEGFKVGLMTGMGAAFADGTYGLVAALGLTAISSFLIAQKFWIQLIGGCFLLYLGVKLFLTPPPETQKEHRGRSPRHAFITTFLLTLTNPTTILSFVAVFLGLGLGTTNNTSYADAILLVLGITLGSAAWWLFLSGGIAFVLHHRLNLTVMRWINRCSGIILLAFGIFALSISILDVIKKFTV